MPRFIIQGIATCPECAAGDKPEQVGENLRKMSKQQGAAWQSGLLIFGAAQYADAYSNCHYYRASQGKRAMAGLQPNL